MKTCVCVVAILFVLAASAKEKDFAHLLGRQSAHVYALPTGDPRCDLYRVTVDGQEVPVSAM